MTNRQFVIFCKAAKDKPCKYMWGTYGTTHNKTHIDEDNIASKARQYPSHYDTKYQAELRSCIGTHIGCDCTGLIKWFLWTGGNIEQAPVYNKVTDYSASGWYRSAKVRGDIDTRPERPGIILAFPGHCGVYIGGGQVIECTKGQFGNGVVQTNLTDRKWKKWCECPYISYESEKPTDGQETACLGSPARVIKDCPAYATANCKQVIGTIYKEDSIRYIGDYNAKLAIVLYPTAATVKIAFADRNNIIKE